MNSNQKQPLSPQELFNRLRSGDFKEAECQDEAARLRMQRDILIQLILEYEEQIKKAHAYHIQQQQLLALREKLLVELETLRNERAFIDTKIAEELAKIRLTPVENRDRITWTEEITESRSRNNKLRVRIRDMMGYIQKLQFQNQRLEEERRVITVTEMSKRQAGEDWRQKIQALKREQFSYQVEIRDKLRLKEQNALKKIQAQQLEIRQRNQRRRMESMHCKLGTPIHQLYNQSYIREI